MIDQALIMEYNLQSRYISNTCTKGYDPVHATIYVCMFWWENKTYSQYRIRSTSRSHTLASKNRKKADTSDQTEKLSLHWQLFNVCIIKISKIERFSTKNI